MSRKRTWGGRFRKETDALTEAFTESISFDRTLYRHDIEGSIAHAEMLAKAGLLKPREKSAIIKGLRGILRDIEAGRFEFRAEDEDIHMNVERALQERIGEPAGKLHTARSRNDQVALDLRLWVRNEIEAVTGRVRAVQSALVELAGRYAASPMPGYTHMQRAQPVTCGHWLLAYVEMFERDVERLADCRERADVLPLGACALAGTSLPIDPRVTARLLGFGRIARNSMDAVSDRDFAVEFAFCLACAAMHMSRLASDLVLMAASEYGFAILDDAFCTGSSIMPQKKNPDVLELIRGKCGRVIGAMNSLMILLKGLPLAYNRDMQEDKEPLFDASRQVSACLDVLAPLLRQTEFDEVRMREACGRGFMDATVLAEYLAARGVPFRRAHRIVGELVGLAESRGVELAGLSDEDLRRAHPLLGPDARKVLGAAGAVLSYASPGSANPAFVRREVAAWRKRLSRPAGRAR